MDLAARFAWLSAVVVTSAAFGCGNGSEGTSAVGDSGKDARADATFDGMSDGTTDAPRDAGPDAPSSDAKAASPRGVYVPTFHKPIATDPVLQEEIKEPYVDGFFLSRSWDEIETVQTSPATYDFTTLDADIRTVGAAGKKASIGIGGGSKAPPWLCKGPDDGGKTAQCVPFVSLGFSAETGTTGVCNVDLLPVPWDPVYQAGFGNMVAALGAHILGDSTLSSTVVLLKVTGFNDTDEETILPFGKGGTKPCTSGSQCMAGECAQTDALTALKAAGYTDTVATTALLTFASDFRSAFPGMPIGSQVSGALPSPGSDSLPLVMVQAFVGDTSARPITVQDNGLRATMGVDPGTLYAREAGVPVGYQMYAAVYGGNPKCTMGAGLSKDGGPVTCNEGVLMDAIDNGITNGGARWLEIYETDVQNYPDAATYAHAKLVGP
jgi:hypothetical protein